MQNKKGFTLVELLAVIAILGILVAIAVPSTLAISKKIKTNMWENKKKLVSTAVELWEDDNKVNCSKDLPTLTIEQLIEQKYLKADDKSGNFTDNNNTDVRSRRVQEVATDINIRNTCSYYAIYIAEIDADMKASGFKQQIPSEGIPLSKALDEYCDSGCSSISKDNFFLFEGGVYEDYKIREKNDSYIAYRALYNYTVTMKLNGVTDRVIKQKVDNDLASVRLNYTPPKNYKVAKNTCYRTYYEDNEFQIYTSDAIYGDITCEINMVPKTTSNE